jgi:hypothetical protein
MKKMDLHSQTNDFGQTMGLAPRSHEPPRQLRRGGVLGSLMPALAVLATALAGGCVTMGSFMSGDDCPPTGDICQVVATWNNEVVYTPDPTHAGTPTPGLAGRVYLFGPNLDFPRAGNGMLVIDLFDETQKPSASHRPILLEEWRFDKLTLQRLLRRDAIGWGYTLFLPWGTYKPELNRIHLKVRYEPATGTPVYAEGGHLALLNATESGPLAARHSPAPAAPAASPAGSPMGPAASPVPLPPPTPLPSGAAPTH